MERVSEHELRGMQETEQRERRNEVVRGSLDAECKTVQGEEGGAAKAVPSML